MPSRRFVLLLAIFAALLGAAAATPQTPAPVSATTFVINGRGWGHGVGMSQWGAYGYAKRGVTYDKILAHYYPGTKLAPAPAAKIKVLLIESAHTVVVSSLDPFYVQDATGALHDLPDGNYTLDSTLTLPLGPDAEPQQLPGPLRFLPGKSPLWLAHPYRGSFVVTATGKRLSVVNAVTLDGYVRGVVSSEMPHDWPLEAVKAQAVASRSYALSHKKGGAFDVYNDNRDQVYGGIAAETPVGEQAVEQTARQVLLYDGKVAETFFYASSGGRTAAITDVFAGSMPMPYLVSVPDPYDTASPYHTWGPVVIPAAMVGRSLGVPGLIDVKPVPAKGRARAFVAIGKNGDESFSAGDFRRALGLRSTWVTIGVLSLTRDGGRFAAGTSVTLTGRAENVKDATLEQRSPGGDWQTGPALALQPDGTFSLAVTPSATTQYRLAAGTAKGAALTVVVG